MYESAFLLMLESMPKIFHLLEIPGVMLWLWLLSIVIILLPFSKKTKATIQNNDNILFPSISKTELPLDSALEENRTLSPKPCSTGLTTRLLPFKNANGEIEWVFSDDLQPGSELDAFKFMPDGVKKMKNENTHDVLSPVTSNSSNNESISSQKQMHSDVAQVNTPSSTSSEDHKEDEKESDDGDHDQLHQCPHCDSSFKMRGYLTRHLKKHSFEKAYKCPFHKSSVYRDGNNMTHKCHPNGGFSRRDTYKTHMKSRHFRYPDGLSIKERHASPGNCSMCGEWFQNAEIWSELHIEGAECKYLPVGFKGKSRIKNRLKKQMARLLREQKQNQKKGVQMGAMGQADQSPTLCTPSSINTPLVNSASAYDYENSPTQSMTSSTGRPTPTHHMPQMPMARPLMPNMNYALQRPDSQSLMGGIPEDYDDDYCLDTEQMSAPIPIAMMNYPSMAADSFAAQVGHMHGARPPEPHQMQPEVYYR